jgi:hypothetical protein
VILRQAQERKEEKECTSMPSIFFFAEIKKRPAFDRTLCIMQGLVKKITFSGQNCLPPVMNRK